MTTHPPARPPFDPELDAVLEAIGRVMSPTITPDMIPAARQEPSRRPTPETLAAAGLEARDVVIPGFAGASIEVSVVQPVGRTGTGPGIFHIHGGGMILGDRWSDLETFAETILRHDAVFVTVEYRLAPEFPDPVPVEDCYAGLVWTAENAAELGIDPDRLLIIGVSAGGGLAAGTTLLARDRGGPRLCGQMLFYPMLDDRDRTVSTLQIDGVGIWDRTSNITGWSALLGDRRGTDDVSIYAAPARATDLSGLPPTFIDCGSAEVFRDEDVAYASGIWAAGGQAELHVWPGGFHAFEGFVPGARLSQEMIAARANWLARMLAP
ncbi:alpha/beta hydrolase [Microbacterium caowuchunii]|uniref:Alpha/beta hydrolase n=1 Tax=Microbacterium caowuchunii TaxID=2614638 RepID=A0A5N0TIX8_9MICO|nr:alpha/beta hydrolase [Microbacterium caowuchunii]KAA9134394.1 alpha/beta hydrolase [Microbacterium caowuchunii]